MRIVTLRMGQLSANTIGADGEKVVATRLFLYKKKQLLVVTVAFLVIIVGHTGFEPVNYGFRVHCLTDLANAQ